MADALSTPEDVFIGEEGSRAKAAMTAGLAPLPLGVFAAFLSFRKRWEMIQDVFDNMPGPKHVGRFGAMTYDQVVRIVRDAEMSDTKLKTRAKAFVEQSGVPRYYANSYYKMLRLRAQDFLRAVARSDQSLRLRHILINMIHVGDVAAIQPLGALFQDEWTSHFLTTAARIDARVRSEMMKRVGVESLLEKVPHDDLIIHIIMVAGTSDTELKSHSKTLSEEEGISAFRARMKWSRLRSSAREALRRMLICQEDYDYLKGVLFQMIWLYGEPTAVRILVDLFPGEETMKNLKRAAKNGPVGEKIYQELVRLSEEREPWYLRAGWQLTTFTKLPPPFAHLDPDR